MKVRSLRQSAEEKEVYEGPPKNDIMFKVVYASRAACGHIKPCGCIQASRKLGGGSCCLRCPFEECLFDVEGVAPDPRQGETAIVKAEERSDRDAAILTLYSWGWGPVKLAEEFNLSKRHVYNLLKKAKKKPL